MRNSREIKSGRDQTPRSVRARRARITLFVGVGVTCAAYALDGLLAPRTRGYYERHSLHRMSSSAARKEAFRLLFDDDLATERKEIDQTFRSILSTNGPTAVDAVTALARSCDRWIVQDVYRRSAVEDERKGIALLALARADGVSILPKLHRELMILNMLHQDGGMSLGFSDHLARLNQVNEYFTHISVFSYFQQDAGQWSYDRVRFAGELSESFRALNLAPPVLPLPAQRFYAETNSDEAFQYVVEYRRSVHDNIEGAFGSQNPWQ